MLKKNFLTTAIAAAALATSPAFAEDHGDMEKCHVVDMDGQGLIKEHMGDCGTKTHSCSGQSKAGDPEAWIYVPKGECDKINEGDFSGVSDEIKDKIEH